MSVAELYLLISTFEGQQPVLVICVLLVQHRSMEAGPRVHWRWRALAIVAHSHGAEMLLSPSA